LTLPSSKSTIDSAIKSAKLSAVKEAIMKYVTANDLKRKGVSVVREAIAEYGDGEAGISVRGKREFVVLDTETYDHLRECEILAAWAETKEDIKAGRYVEESTEEHIARIRKYV
jgi:hypothetical protein